MCVGEREGIDRFLTESLCDLQFFSLSLSYVTNPLFFYLTLTSLFLFIYLLGYKLRMTNTNINILSLFSIK